jgi:hypothetical protein
VRDKEFYQALFHGQTKGFNSITRVDIEGLDEMLNEIDRLGEVGMVAARDAMTAKAQEIKAKAAPLVPDDPESPGLLKDTLRVYAPRTSSLKRGKTIFAGVVIGGKKLEAKLGKRAYSAWALVQHEDLTLKHKRGQAKFLERPGNQVAPSIPDAIMAKLDAATGGMGAR